MQLCIIDLYIFPKNNLLNVDICNYISLRNYFFKLVIHLRVTLTYYDKIA